MSQCRLSVGHPLSERVRRHVLSQLLCLGRHTLTGILGTAGQLFCDWTADYRMYAADRIDPQALFAPVRQTLLARLAPGHPLVAALDDTRLHKSGRKIHGVRYVRDPLGPPFHVNFIKAQRFLQISLASAADDGSARMIPADFVHAPSPQRPRPGADQQTIAQFRITQRDSALPKVAADRLRILRFAMDHDGHQHRPLWAGVDGGYTNRTFLRHLPPRTVTVGRVRADAKLYHPPAPPPGTPGRHRVYGQRAPTPDQLRRDDSVPWQTVDAFAAGRIHHFKVKTMSPLRWRVTGKEISLRLIVVAPLRYRLSKNSRLLYRQPAFLICTDPTASIPDVLKTYLWRWDIEVNFRDEKTLLGVGHAQVRHERSVESVPALAVAAYAILLTAATHAFGPTGQPDSLPPPKWRCRPARRASTQSLINHLRHEVWAQSINSSGFASHTTSDTKPQKCLPSLEGALFYASG